MILSVSRRTDIPAWYTEWFFNRLRDGSACVRNPVNPRMVSRVGLSPAEVDCIVFWSKNPAPLLERLHLLADYPFYVQFTLNAYGPDVEPLSPPLEGRIETFRRLVEKTGPGAVIWRYDPILINRSYTAAYHIDHFGKTAEKLAGYTKRVTISFVDVYRKNRANLESLAAGESSPGENALIARALAGIARSRGLAIDACAEEADFSPYGIARARCIDERLASELSGRTIAPGKAGLRPECRCAAAIDIGAYDTCPGGCRYCYANSRRETAEANHALHDPASPLLTGSLRPGDTLRDRAPPVQSQQLNYE
ncbi:MAG: DUF1848 domain-containing protein [Spirochaetaceae bacterium]|jgi:hypothetical protein|nr:DUF1848 domain-containing protein [Spirochaetaceae bacterium]